jgi:hypothetical protein
MTVYVLQRYYVHKREFADIVYFHSEHNLTLNSTIINPNNENLTPGNTFELEHDTDTWIPITDYEIIIKVYKNVQTLLDGNLWELKTSTFTNQLNLNYGLVGKTSTQSLLIVTARNIQTNAYIVTTVQYIPKNIGDIMYLQNSPYQRKHLTIQGGLTFYHEHNAYWVNPNITKRFTTNIQYHNFILYNIYPKHKLTHIFDIKDNGNRILSTDSKYNNFSLIVGVFHGLKEIKLDTTMSREYIEELQIWTITPGYYYCKLCLKCFHLKSIFDSTTCTQCNYKLRIALWRYKAHYNNTEIILQVNTRIHIDLTLSHWLLVHVTEDSTRLGYVMDILPTITTFKMEKLFRKHNLLKQH